MLSVVTPPVALAAFAAAPIAGSKPMETGITALRLSIAGFIIPFLFVSHPDILIIEGFSVFGFVYALVVFITSTCMIASGLGRFQTGAIPIWDAGLRLVAGIVALHPTLELSIVGVLAAWILTGIHRKTGIQVKSTHW